MPSLDELRPILFGPLFRNDVRHLGDLLDCIQQPLRNETLNTDAGTQAWRVAEANRLLLAVYRAALAHRQAALAFYRLDASVLETPPQEMWTLRREWTDVFYREFELTERALRHLVSAGSSVLDKATGRDAFSSVSEQQTLLRDPVGAACRRCACDCCSSSPISPYARRPASTTERIFCAHAIAGTRAWLG